MNQKTNVSKDGELNWSVFASINNPLLMNKFKKNSIEYNKYNSDSNYYIVFNGTEFQCANYMSDCRRRVN